jgi:hypothetical protein
MIQTYVDRFMAPEGQATLRAALSQAHPSYRSLVTDVIKVIAADDYDAPDPERIHEIDDGDYQGTLLYVIGARGYQPSDYFYVKVRYGSCSGCDTLQGIREYQETPPREDQIKDYMTLALHIVQGLKKLGED